MKTSTAVDQMTTWHPSRGNLFYLSLVSTCHDTPTYWIWNGCLHPFQR